MVDFGTSLTNLGDGFALNEQMADLFIRIYRLDPENYSNNEWHVKNEFEKLAASAVTAAERLEKMQAALKTLQQAVADLEYQQQQAQSYVIDEEPDTEELLSWAP